MRETPMAERSLIDIDAVLERLNGNRDMLGVLVDFFLEDAPKILESMQAAFSQHSSIEVVRHAHALKGLAATFEPNSVVDLASEIEQRGKNIEPTHLAELMKNLDSQFTQLVSDLEPLRSLSQ